MHHNLDMYKYAAQKLAADAIYKVAMSMPKSAVPEVGTPPSAEPIKAPNPQKSFTPQKVKLPGVPKFTTGTTSGSLK